MDNMRYWEPMRRPPETALKKIQGGRLAGKSDINPQWRLKTMTSVFGPCGIGWKYEVIRFWSEEGEGGQKFAFAHIHLFVKDGDTWSEPVPGIGGSMLIEKERSGLHSSDEGYKMALTDALSVAMKALGMAADIYEGLFDGSKYADKPAPQKSGYKVDNRGELMDKIGNYMMDEADQDKGLASSNLLQMTGKKSLRDLTDAELMGLFRDLEPQILKWEEAAK